MGSLSQQINLYRGAADAAATPASVRLLMLTGIGAILAVTVVAVAGEFMLSRIEADRVAVASALDARRQELAIYRSSRVMPPVDPHLEAELQRLNRTQRHLSASLIAVGRERALMASGFAGFFGGLARHTIDGLWFNRVSLKSAGRAVVLTGQAVEPQLVPRFLQVLSAEQAFSGLSFSDVVFERRNSDGDVAVIDFELRSSAQTGNDDAG
jgi:hypothetical protein